MHRIDRFMAAWALDKGANETEPDTPYTMVDSGYRISYGERDFQRDYRGMIDGELLRPPGALMWAQRDMPSPSTLNVKVQVTNVTTETLSASTNGAMLHVMVYEGSKALKTGNDIHASRRVDIDTPMARGDTQQFEFEFSNLRGVSLPRSEALAFIDYMPKGGRGRWDMLQAVVATTGELPPIPTPYPTPTSTPTETPVPTDVPTLTPMPSPTPVTFEVYVPYVANLIRMN